MKILEILHNVTRSRSYTCPNVKMKYIGEDVGKNPFCHAGYPNGCKNYGNCDDCRKSDSKYWTVKKNNKINKRKKVI